MRFQGMSIKQVYTLIENEEIKGELVSALLEDGRKGLEPLINKLKRKIKEKESYESLWNLETEYWKKNEIVVGLDEAGRGPLAGPVVAAAVMFTSVPDLIGLKDSKKLSELTKETLLAKIQSQAHFYRVSFIDNNIIDNINIFEATKLAMIEAVKDLNVDTLLIDGNFVIKHSSHQIPVIKGDSKVGSIAAASILAKVYRDRHMLTLHEKYPIYNFAKNKGYPTEEHYWALKKYGPSPVHRITFKGVLEIPEKEDFLCEEYQ